ALAGAPPAAVSQALVRAAKRFAGQQPLPTGLIADEVVSAAEAALRGMGMARILKLLAAVGLVLLLGAIAGLLWWLMSGEPAGKAPEGEQRAPGAAAVPAPRQVPDIEKLQGQWRFAKARGQGGDVAQAMANMRVEIEGNE